MIFKNTSLYIIIIRTIITSVINITVLNGQGLVNGQIQIKGIVITNNKTKSLIFLSWVVQFPTQVKLYKNTNWTCQLPKVTKSVPIHIPRSILF